MNQNHKKFYVLLGTLLLLAARPGQLLACAACYGDPDSSMSVGLTWAISVLVVVVGCVLAGVVSFFVHTARHAETDVPPARDDSDSKEI